MGFMTCFHSPKAGVWPIMDNIRGSVLMTIAMLGFAVEDMFIKQMSGALPIGQILWILGVGGGATLAIWG